MKSLLLSGRHNRKTLTKKRRPTQSGQIVECDLAAPSPRSLRTHPNTYMYHPPTELIYSILTLKRVYTARVC